jgi:L-2-hydroxyglutarate oxidase
MIRAFSPGLFAKAVSQFMPGIAVRDLLAGGAGVRAQAVDRSGKLVDDLVLLEQPAMLHALNAPSSAATASLSTWRTIARKALKAVGFGSRNLHLG